MGDAQTWESLGEVDPPALVGARIALHWAAQLVAAAGHTWLEKRADDSESALTWIDERGALASEPLAGGGRVALLIEPFAIAITRSGGMQERLPLGGHTFALALAQLGAALGHLHGEPDRPLVPPKHEMPPDPVGRGAAFVAPTAEALRELSRWYSCAASVLTDIAATSGASPVRCWPHHFDIATLVSLGTGDPVRTIGMGLSPGDGSYSEPYFYVTPWPYPTPGHPPPLPIGRWHEVGWFGAVLTGTDLLRFAPGARRFEAQRFLDIAYKSCRALISK